MELAATHEVLLATGRPRRVSPERILGRSIFWWMDKLGILRASREMRVGRHLMRTDPFPGKALGGRLRRRGIRVVGRLGGDPRGQGRARDFLHQRGFSLRGLVSTSSDEAGSGRADLPCSPGSAKTPRI